jgi:integrase
MKLTIKSTEGLKLPPGKVDFIAWDDDVTGFGLRLREGGSRTWIYQYRIGSKQRRMVLGSARAVTLSLARENAGKLEAKVKLGGDPAMEKETARRDADNTVGALLDQYLEAKKAGKTKRKVRPRSYAEIERHLKTHAKPLHRLPIGAMSQRDVASLLGDVATEAGNVTSNRVRASLSAFLAWALGEGIRLPEGNVASYTNKRDEKSRDRVLDNPRARRKSHELKAIWDSCEDDDYGAIIKLLVLTGQRANEIAGLRWDEILHGEIVLPGERTKNHRTHIVPLSDPARAILAKLEKEKEDRSHVFGRDDTGFQGWSKAKEKLGERMAEAGTTIPHWTPHDIRRSVATHMAEIGIQPHIIEAVLNHVSGHKAGIAGIYNRATYDKEKREALNRWAEYLLGIVENRAAVVVEMKRA